MHYLKNSNPLASYVDPDTRKMIRRGTIGAFDTLSKDIKMRLRSRGLIEVTEEEYLKQEAGKNSGRVSTDLVQDNKNEVVSAATVEPLEEKPEDPKSAGAVTEPEAQGEPKDKFAAIREKAKKAKSKE